MITSNADLKNASPKTKRRVRYELELEDTARQCVFAANKTTEFRSLMREKVYGDSRFDQLPLYRQACIEAYVRGCLDTAATMVGHATVTRAPDHVSARRLSTLPPVGEVCTGTPRPSARAGRPTTIRPPASSLPATSIPAGLWGDLQVAARTLTPRSSL